MHIKPSHTLSCSWCFAQHEHGGGSILVVTRLGVIVRHPDLILVWTVLATTLRSLPRFPPGARHESEVDGFFWGHGSWNNRIIGVLRLWFYEEELKKSSVPASFLKFTSDFWDGSIQICLNWDIQRVEEETRERQEGKGELWHQRNTSLNQTLQLHNVYRV